MLKSQIESSVYNPMFFVVMLEPNNAITKAQVESAIFMQTNIQVFLDNDPAPSTNIAAQLEHLLQFDSVTSAEQMSHAQAHSMTMQFLSFFDAKSIMASFTGWIDNVDTCIGIVIVDGKYLGALWFGY